MVKRSWRRSGQGFFRDHVGPPFAAVFQAVDDLAGGLEIEFIGLLDAVTVHELANVDPLIAGNGINCRVCGRWLPALAVAFAVRGGVAIAVGILPLPFVVGCPLPFDVGCPLPFVLWPFAGGAPLPFVEGP